jgi:hypothetical protein
MTIKELKHFILELPDEAEFVISSDEELNTIYSKWEVVELEKDNEPVYCIYGFSGTEVEIELNEENI